MFEFSITKVHGGFELADDGETIAVFATEAMAISMAVRFAQDMDAPSYRIFYLP